jgi:energy-coupling factor transport system ATP-binding protein
MIRTSATEFSYPASGSAAPAVAGVSLCIGKGEFVSVLGRNGSGKSTLARLFNALLLPTCGEVRTGGIDSRDPEGSWEIRRLAGMVFPNPDNQFVGSTVEEDVAFGPENLGLPPVTIAQRVHDALQVTGMARHAARAPHLLSGGEKQRVALAGILAMAPDCLILDEATAMLDGAGRAEIMALVRRLNREHGLTVIHITHDPEEAALADRIVVLAEGRVVLDGTPRDVFADSDLLRQAGLELPPVTELCRLLRSDGFDIPAGILLREEAVAALLNAAAGSGSYVSCD